jgi:hypothetical protein
LDSRLLWPCTDNSEANVPAALCDRRQDGADKPFQAFTPHKSADEEQQIVLAR